MEFGIHLLHRSPVLSRSVLRNVARAAEASGFSALWLSDHVVVPVQTQSRYPYNESGDVPFGAEAPFPEVITLLSFLAGCTERIRLGTDVLIVPYRNPVVQAKALATLDCLSDGRLTVGVGTGWLAEEFAALNVPFEHRGGRTDEYIRLMKALWQSDSPGFEGRFYRLDRVGFVPRPQQQPHPPLWCGGHSEAAFRRAGTLCDGWLGLSVPPDALAEQFSRVQAYAQSDGRDPRQLTLAVGGVVRLAREAEGERVWYARSRRTARLASRTSFWEWACSQQRLPANPWNGSQLAFDRALGRERCFPFRVIRNVVTTANAS